MLLCNAPAVTTPPQGSDLWRGTISRYHSLFMQGTTCYNGRHDSGQSTSTQCHGADGVVWTGRSTTGCLAPVSRLHGYGQRQLHWWSGVAQRFDSRCSLDHRRECGSTTGPAGRHPIAPYRRGPFPCGQSRARCPVCSQLKQRPSRRKRLRSALAGTWTLAAAGPLVGGLGPRPGGRRGGGRTAAIATAADGPGA